jgi:hypothetical protein
MDEPTVLTMPRQRQPFCLASWMAASVSAVSPDCEMAVCTGGGTHRDGQRVGAAEEIAAVGEGARGVWRWQLFRAEYADGWRLGRGVGEGVEADQA